MDNPNRENEPKRKRSFGKRFLRFLLISAVVFIAIFLLGILLFRLYFPPDKIRRIADDYARQYIHRRLSIGAVSVNPWRGFEIHDLSLTRLPDFREFDSLPIDSASVERVLLRYSLAGLLKKRIQINRVEIVSPRIAATIRQVQPDSTPAKTTGNPLAILDSLKLPESPLHLDLDQARITDAGFSLSLVDSLVQQRVLIDKLGLEINGLKIPKGQINNSGLGGRISLSDESGRVSYLLSQAADTLLFADGLFHFNLDAVLSGLALKPVRSSIRLDSLAWRGMLVDAAPFRGLPIPVVLTLTSRIDLNEKRLSLNPVALYADDEKWIQFKAEATNLSTKPELDFKLTHGRIQLQQLLSIAERLLPDSLMPEIYMHNPRAHLTINELSAKGLIPINPDGTEESIRFKGRASLEDLGITLNFGEIELNSFSIIAGTKGVISRHGLADLSGDLEVRYDSLSAQANDTTALSTGPLRIKAHTTNGPDLLPNKIVADLALSSLFGASVEGAVNLAGSSFSALRGKGSVTVTDLYTGNLPNAPAKTMAHASLHLSVQTLDSLSILINADADSIRLQQGQDNLVFPPVHLNSSLVGRTDARFDEIVVENWSTEVTDLLQARIAGKAFPKQKGLEIHLEEITLPHKHLLQWLPGQYKSLLEELELTGNTKLTGSASASLAGQNPEYQARFLIDSEIKRLAFPPMYLSLGNMKILLEGGADSRNGTFASVELGIDSARVEALRPDPLLNTRLQFQINSPDFTSARIDSGRLLVPSLGTEALFSVRVDSLPSAPYLSASTVVEQNAPQPISLTREIALSGSSRAQATTRMDSAHLFISGELNARDIFVYLPSKTEIRDIDAHIRFSQGVDLTTGTLVRKSRPQFATPSTSTIDYHLFRPFYLRTRNDISTVSIAQIQAAGYAVNNIRMEAYLGEGAVEVPSLSAKIYGGNMDGRFSFDLAGGNPDSMSYLLSSHFSGINSALLLPQGSEGAGDGIINANLNLTGSGLNPEGSMNFGGFFYITQIGPRVADNLLRSLDPEGIDSGIKLTRWFINQGFKPRLFTFMIRNNYFYPTVEFNQPFYFPVRLSGGRVELNRMPANFFIRTALKNARMQSAKR